MTPKEKADELVKKMYKVMSDSVSDITLYFSKQCALVAVDEIIKNGGTKHIIEYKPNSYTNEVWYWEQVKQEIEKL